jgi:hypothetical protein
MLKNILIIFFLLFALGCYNTRPKNLILFDFELDNELDKLHWKCHTLLNLSDEYAIHGKKSLRMEVYPSECPGLAPNLKTNDWQGYESFKFDAFNPLDKEVRVTVRIDDRGDNPDYADRYNHGFILIPGWNKLDIPLNDLITSGTDRKLDLKNIQGLVIFMVSPSEKVTIYVDYIRLESQEAGRRSHTPSLGLRRTGRADGGRTV